MTIKQLGEERDMKVSAINMDAAFAGFEIDLFAEARGGHCDEGLI
jgi:hypothetical protein